MPFKKFIVSRHPVTNEDIYLFRLRNRAGTELTISNYGALLQSFICKTRDGNWQDIVLGFDNIDQYFHPDYLASYPYFGVAVGRYANRIQHARFTVDGKEYRLAKNLGDHHLHGGMQGFDKKIWKPVGFQEQENLLHLRYTSPDGEEGYPGKLQVNFFIQLHEDNRVDLVYEAVTDQPTPVNLSHHSYFNLDGRPDISDHELGIPASIWLEQDETLCTTGGSVPVENTRFDFRQPRKILNDRQGYDQSFVLDKEDDNMSLAAELYSPHSGIRLRVFTTDPVLHLYTAQGLNGIRGKNNQVYGPFSAVCLETQVHPNAINIPHFPNTILRPLHTYRQENAYLVSID